MWFQRLKKLMEETHAGSLAGHFTLQYLILGVLVGKNVQLCALILPQLLDVCLSWWNRSLMQSSTVTPPSVLSFDRVGVDIYWRCHRERKTVFIDYLTKQVEA